MIRVGLGDLFMFKNKHIKLWIVVVCIISVVAFNCLLSLGIIGSNGISTHSDAYKVVILNTNLWTHKIYGFNVDDDKKYISIATKYHLFSSCNQKEDLNTALLIYDEVNKLYPDYNVYVSTGKRGSSDYFVRINDGYLITHTDEGFDNDEIINIVNNYDFLNGFIAPNGVNSLMSSDIVSTAEKLGGIISYSIPFSIGDRFPDLNSIDFFYYDHDEQETKTSLDFLNDPDNLEYVKLSIDVTRIDLDNDVFPHVKSLDIDNMAYGQTVGLNSVDPAVIKEIKRAFPNALIRIDGEELVRGQQIIEPNIP